MTLTGQELKTLAQLLFSVVEFGEEGEFELAGGFGTTCYVDLREPGQAKVTSGMGAKLLSCLVEHLEARIPKDVRDCVLVGVPRAGNVFVRELAKLTGMPFAILEKESDEVLEGSLRPGDRVVVVENVATTGRSLYQFILRLQRLGVSPVLVLACVDREQGQTASRLLSGNGVSVSFTAIVTLQELLEEWERVGKITAQQRLDAVRVSPFQSRV
ncbi:MAG: hypothetical protein Q8Q38_02415 [bacterium]|nr:hypothetical protein [bacterium]MDZ4231938.1 hypothetical protein [Candidatus Pacearchaeota archaeon]